LITRIIFGDEYRSLSSSLCSLLHSPVTSPLKIYVTWKNKEGVKVWPGFNCFKKGLKARLLWTQRYALELLGQLSSYTTLKTNGVSWRWGQMHHFV
jgi:hypothetical protein